jgi:hypothetical protein
VLVIAMRPTNPTPGRDRKFELVNHHPKITPNTDAPALDDDPQARLLVQVQGVIAEYQRAKIAERYRRGKLWRARRGEVTVASR